MSVSVRDAYIADGFADDCDELIHRLTTGEKLTYAAFAHVWKDMQMAGIYHNRTSGAEIAELSEEVIHIAKRYMVADTSNFEENVAGLFLVYALLNVQPFTGFANLRVVQDDLPAIERIEFVARRDRRMDVLYILGSVLIKGPVQYHAALRERGMEYPYRKYLEGNSNINNLGVRPKGVFYRQGKEMDLIRELKNLSVQYSKVKEEISGPDVKDPNLNYYDVHFPTKLETSFKKLITGTLDSDDDDDDDDDEGEARPGCSSGLVKDVDSIRSIKDRAMKAKVNPMKHLVGVADRYVYVQ
ncbi:snRNA-activating protein complex subunit 1-like [Trichoplusia ni]|uniref:snRNA-activating protein complex subunit 1-like n=1 Tax=Trichoplusia ni TaxID=7111 RepID=A0A7E5VJR2_TRINI|nr:snRNA-activating protein complex subunit 1-like [Trichoplusia ni]XP_026728436.1 snRNA-activating protein complex subunit 1-like [Trichoplusia ni]